MEYFLGLLLTQSLYTDLKLSRIMDIRNLAVCAARHMTFQTVVFKTQESKDLTLKENFNLAKYSQYL